MSNRPTFAMTAIVIGTYVCALVGAREAPRSDKSVLPRPAYRATAATRPSVAAAPVAIASVDNSSR
jgi:hypothetical protein